MAPESLTEREYSSNNIFLRVLTFLGKTDVFSYGVTLWEIVTRAEPWEGLNGMQATRKFLEGTRLEISENCYYIFKVVKK
jgi:hypothetical protein